MERLENSRWGFESNCFVCEAANPAGLGLEFFADPDENAVVAEFSLDHRFSGAPSYVHGGLVLAVVDEAMAWATIALARSWAVTKETTTRFRAPVRVDRTYRVRAEVEADDGDELRCRAEVTDGDGTVCATATATFVPLGPAHAVDAIGAAVEGADADYVRGDRKARR
jgi:acyl-coenzyme A thioesterase PaaI-like protein